MQPVLNSFSFAALIVKKQKKRSMSFSLDVLEIVRMVGRDHKRVRQSTETHWTGCALSILKQPGEMVILLFFLSILLRRHQGEPPQLQHQQLMTEFSYRLIYSQCERCQSPRRRNLTQIHRFSWPKRTLCTFLFPS